MYSIKFTKRELQILVKITSCQVNKNLNIWLSLAQKSDVITDGMRKQFHYTGELKEISDKVATPIGLNKSRKLTSNNKLKWLHLWWSRIVLKSLRK